MVGLEIQLLIIFSVKMNLKASIFHYVKEFLSCLSTAHTNISMIIYLFLL